MVSANWLDLGDVWWCPIKVVFDLQELLASGSCSLNNKNSSSRSSNNEQQTLLIREGVSLLEVSVSGRYQLFKGAAYGMRLLSEPVHL